MADIQSNININVDTSNATAAIRKLQAQISAFHQQMQKSGSAANVAASANMQRNLQNSISATGKFATNLTTVKTETEAFTGALEKNKLSMGQYFRYAGASSRTFGRMFRGEFNTISKVAESRVRTLQTQYIKMGRDASGAMKAIAVRPLSLDMKNLSTQTMIASQKQQIFNQVLRQGSTNLLNFGKNTQWAGRQLMVGFTVPLSIMGMTAIKEFQKIEEQVIKLKRVYGDMFTTNAETERAVQQVRQLADEFTRYGIAVESTIGLAASVAQMGNVGADMINQVTEATKLAILGGMEQEKALDTTISLTNAFGIAAEDLTEKINFLNAAENQTILAIDDFTEAVPKAGSVVAQLGGSVEDLAFFLTAMREGGVNASQAANALKSSLARLINPTQQARDDLNKLGIDVMSIVEGNVGDLRGTIFELGDALDGLQPLERSRALEELFGKFQFARMSTLFQNISKEGSQAQEILKLTRASAAELQILADRELSRVEESPATKLEKQIEKLQAALAPIGEEFVKLVTPIVEFFTGLLKKFNEMDEGAKSFVTGLVTVLGLIAPAAIMTFGLIANGVANVLKAFNAYRSFLQILSGSNRDVTTQTQYMTQEQLEAASVAANLGQAHQYLSQQFTVEASALNSLTAAYQAATSEMMRYNTAAMGVPARPVRVAPPVTRASTGRRAGSPAGPVGYNKGTLNVPGPRGAGDIVPAVLSPGEAVIPAKQSQKYSGFLEAIMNDEVPGMFFGGIMGNFMSKFKKPGFSEMSKMRQDPRVIQQWMRGRRNKVGVRMSSDNLFEMLASGDSRYSNLFDTGKSAVGDTARERALVEKRLFGIDQSAPGSQRPVYGYMFNKERRVSLRGKNRFSDFLTRFDFGKRMVAKKGFNYGTGNLLNDETFRYGNLTLVPNKKAIKNRTTLTYGDSYNARNQEFANPLPWTQAGKATQKRIKESYTSKDKFFVEAQIMGGFDLKDVDRIITTQPKLRPVIEDRLRKAGYNIPVGLPKYSFMDQIKRIFYPDRASENQLPTMDRRGIYKDRSFAPGYGRMSGTGSDFITEPGLEGNLFQRLFGAIKGYENGVFSVPGPKGAGDIVPAMLAPGEAVVPAKQTAKYAGLIKGIISDNIPGFQGGRDGARFGQRGSNPAQASHFEDLTPDRLGSTLADAGDDIDDFSVDIFELGEAAEDGTRKVTKRKGSIKEVAGQDKDVATGGYTYAGTTTIDTAERNQAYNAAGIGGAPFTLEQAAAQGDKAQTRLDQGGLSPQVKAELEAIRAAGQKAREKLSGAASSAERLSYMHENAVKAQKEANLATGKAKTAAEAEAMARKQLEPVLRQAKAEMQEGVAADDALNRAKNKYYGKMMASGTGEVAVGERGTGGGPLRDVATGRGRKSLKRVGRTPGETRNLTYQGKSTRDITQKIFQQGLDEGLTEEQALGGTFASGTPRPALEKEKASQKKNRRSSSPQKTVVAQEAKEDAQIYTNEFTSTVEQAPSPYETISDPEDNAQAAADGARHGRKYRDKMDAEVAAGRAQPTPDRRYPVDENGFEIIPAPDHLFSPAELEERNRQRTQSGAPVPPGQSGPPTPPGQMPTPPGQEPRRRSGAPAGAPPPLPTSPGGVPQPGGYTSPIVDPLGTPEGKRETKKSVGGFVKNFGSKFKNVGKAIGNQALKVAENSSIGQNLMSGMARAGGNTLVGSDGNVMYDAATDTQYDSQGNVVARGNDIAAGTAAATSRGEPGDISQDVVVGPDGNPVVDKKGRPVSQKQADKQARKMASRQKRGMVAGRLGGAMGSASMMLGMTSMMPGVGENPIMQQIQGFMPALFALSAVLPILAALPGPLAALVAIVGAGVTAFVMFNNELNKVKKEARELGESLMAGSKTMDGFAEFAGTVSPTQARDVERSAFGEQVSRAAGKTDFGIQYISSETGQEFVETVEKGVSELGKSQTIQNVSNQLANAVASGVLSRRQAGEIALELGRELDDYDFSIGIAANLNELFGPNGEKLLDGDPLELAINLAEGNTKNFENTISSALNGLGNDNSWLKIIMGDEFDEIQMESFVGGALTGFMEEQQQISDTLVVNSEKRIEALIEEANALKAAGKEEEANAKFLEVDAARNKLLEDRVELQGNLASFFGDITEVGGEEEYEILVSQVMKEDIRPQLETAGLESALAGTKDYFEFNNFGADVKGGDGLDMTAKEAAEQALADTEAYLRRTYTTAQSLMDEFGVEAQDKLTTLVGDVATQGVLNATVESVKERFEEEDEEVKKIIDKTLEYIRDQEDLDIQTRILLTTSIGTKDLSPENLKFLVEAAEEGNTKPFEIVGDIVLQGGADAASTIDSVLSTISDYADEGEEDEIISNVLNSLSGLEGVDLTQTLDALDTMSSYALLLGGIDPIKAFTEMSPDEIKDFNTQLVDFQGLVDRAGDEPIKVETILEQNVLIDDRAVTALKENQEYFESLDPLQQKLYVQTFLSVIGSVTEDEALANILDKGIDFDTIEDRDKLVKQEMVRIAADYAEDVTEAAGLFDFGTGQSAPAGSGGGPAGSMLDSLASKLKLVRDETVKFTKGWSDSMAQLMNLFGGDNKITIFDGIQQQLRSLGAGENLIQLIAGMDPDEFEKRKNELFTIKNGQIVALKDAAISIGDALNSIKIGEFQDQQEATLAQMENQETAFQLLRDAGLDVAEAYGVIADEALAAAIATGELTDEEIDNLISKVESVREKSTIAEALEDARKAVEAFNDDIRLQASVEAYIDSSDFDNIKTTFTESPIEGTVVAAAIFRDETLKALIAAGQEGSQAFIDRLNQVLNSDNFLRGIFDEGFQNVQESFRVQEENIRKSFENMLEEANLSEGSFDAAFGIAELAELVGMTQDGVEDLFDSIKDPASVVEAAQQEVATLNFQIDDLNAELEEISNIEEDINEKYDDRIESLEKTEELNSSLARAQKSQLDIADALSKGDIAAAARAIQNARKEEAEARAQEQRDIIEAAREAELEAVRSANGQTRKQIEEEIKRIEQEILQIEEDRLEPAQRLLDLSNLLLEKQIEYDTVLNRTREAWDDLKLKVDNAKIASDAFKDSIQAALDVVNDLIAAYGTLQKPTDEKSDDDGSGDPVVTPEERTGGGFASGNTAKGNPITYTDIGGGKAQASTKYGPSNPVSTGPERTISSGETAYRSLRGESVSDIAKRLGVDESSVRIAQPKSGNKGGDYLYNNQLIYVDKKMSGGLISGYATGGMVSYKAGGGVMPSQKSGAGSVGYLARGGGIGKMFRSINTDTVPAMLTAGEFVVRKSAVDKYGANMLKSVNNGTYGGGSVYNYSVNVNVKSGANPDEIARTVMSNINRIDAQRMRSNRF